MSTLKYYDEDGEHKYSSDEEKCNNCALKCIELGKCEVCLKSEAEYQSILQNKTEHTKKCKHSIGGKINERETLLFCELTDNLETVTLGNCIGNCESQEE